MEEKLQEEGGRGALGQPATGKSVGVEGLDAGETGVD